MGALKLTYPTHEDYFKNHEETSILKVVHNREASSPESKNYYAFGMTMPERTFSSPDYRYGFNGMEKDDEVKGGGNSYDFGARIYDARLGRWLVMDPVYHHSSSQYWGMNNSPIQFLDPDGKLVISGSIGLGTAIYYFFIATTTAYVIVETGSRIKDELEDITPVGSEGTHVTVPDPIALKQTEDALGRPAPGGGGKPDKPGPGLPKGLKRILYGSLAANLIDQYIKTIDPDNIRNKTNITTEKKDGFFVALTYEELSIKKPTNGVLPEFNIVERKVTAKVMYEVKKGDNLTKIAEANNTTVEKLQKLNSIADKDKILIGQELIVNQVEKTETLEFPVLNFNSSTKDAINNNNQPKFKPAPVQ